MKILLISFILITTIGLSACDDSVHSGYYYDDGYGTETVHIDDNHHGSVFPAAPILRAFHVIDSYGLSSELSFAPLVISPYIDQGFFEVFWDVEADTDYRVELSISDNPNYFDSTLISSSICGGLRDCANSSFQFCHYGADLSMECDLPESTTTTGQVDISSMFNTIPEDLFLTLEVCDTDGFYCEYQSREVTFE